MPVDLRPIIRAYSEMGLPDQPVTLSVDQLGELNRELSSLRHDVNNHLSLVMAAVELVRHKPQMTERMLVTIAEQPPKVSEAIVKFSRLFEKALNITKS